VPVLFTLALRFAKKKKLFNHAFSAAQNGHAHVAFKAKLNVGNTFVQLQEETGLSSLTVSLVTDTTVNTPSLLVENRSRHLPHRHHICQQINISVRYKYKPTTHHALSLLR
jgi:hypothetical protein